MLDLYYIRFMFSLCSIELFSPPVSDRSGHRLDILLCTHNKCSITMLFLIIIRTLSTIWTHQKQTAVIFSSELAMRASSARRRKRYQQL